MRLIVNADDLGIGETVNDATFALIDRGLVTSASVVVNGPATQGLGPRCAAYPKVSFGVHLNLSEFAPLTQSRDLAPILDRKGDFRIGAIRSVAITPRLVRAVYWEWKVQLAKFREFGVRPVHLDSHHHVHTIPALFPALKMLQITEGIGRVRTTKNIYAQSPYSRKLLLQKKVWHALLRWTWPSKVTRGFTSFDDFKAVVDKGELDRWLGSDRNLCVEVVVHAGVPNSEADLLDMAWMARHGIRLISYSEL